MATKIRSCIKTSRYSVSIEIDCFNGGTNVLFIEVISLQNAKEDTKNKG